MKKILSLVGILAILVPITASAEVPSDTLFFDNGKGYDVNTGEQNSLCFGVGNTQDCYDIVTMQFLFKRQVLGAIAQPVSQVVSNPSYTLLNIPSQWFPRALNDAPVSDSASSIHCSNSQSWVDSKQVWNLSCRNGSPYTIQVKAVSTVATVKYNGDYTSITNNTYFYTSDNYLWSFIPSLGNVSFLSETFAKVMYEFSSPITIHAQDPLKVSEPVFIVRTLNPVTLVLINVEGKDVVYKVN